jgi:hypothetical protein
VAWQCRQAGNILIWHDVDQHGSAVAGIIGVEVKRVMVVVVDRLNDTAVGPPPGKVACDWPDGTTTY